MLCLCLMTADLTWEKMPLRSVELRSTRVMHQNDASHVAEHSITHIFAWLLQV